MRAKIKDSCIYCGSNEYKFITDRLRYGKTGTVVRCECGLIRLLGASNFKNEEFYQENYAREHRRILKKLDETFKSFLPLQEDRINRFKKYLKKSDELAEIGSSLGYVLYAAKKYVKRVYGIELNDKEAEYARKKGITTVSGISEYNMKFNHICLFHVLEHIPDPILFLKSLKEYLTPYGFIHVEVPSVEDPLMSVYNIKEYEDFFYQQQHLYYFSPGTLKKIVKKAGYKIVSLMPFQWVNFTNHLNWIYYKKPQPNRANCIRACLPTKGGEAVIEKMDAFYKKMLMKKGWGDNIFCILRT